MSYFCLWPNRTLFIPFSKQQGDKVSAKYNICYLMSYARSFPRAHAEYERRLGTVTRQVGGVRISNFGSTMIDSGTTCGLSFLQLTRWRYTYMKSSNYKKLVEGVTKSCGGNKCGGSAHGRNCWKLPNGPSKPES